MRVDWKQSHIPAGISQNNPSGWDVFHELWEYPGEMPGLTLPPTHAYLVDTHQVWPLVHHDFDPLTGDLVYVGSPGLNAVSYDPGPAEGADGGND